jgi:diguanylate cyclase (GGDEF)-like protein
LRSCAQALQPCVRGSDLVARYSGEEFVVVLPGADPQIARQVAERMLAALATADHDPQTGNVRVTASIGVATHTTKKRFATTLALLEAADHALYTPSCADVIAVECVEEISTARRSPIAS